MGGWNSDNVGIHTYGAIGVKPLHIMGWESGCVDPAIRLSYRDTYWGHLALITPASSSISTLNYSSFDTEGDLVLQADTNAGNIVITTRTKGKSIKFGATPDLSGTQPDYERFRISSDGYNTALDIKVPQLWQSPDYGNALLNFRITNSAGYTQMGAGFNWKMGIDASDYNKFKISGNDTVNRNSFDTNFTTFSLSPSGKMGLGTGTPKSYFDIIHDQAGIFSSIDDHNHETNEINPSISLQSECSDYYHTWHIENNCGSLSFEYIPGMYENQASYYPKVTFLSNGNVGIGVINPLEKLVVDGVICATEIMVQLTGSPCWSDYVFDENYKLMPIEELEKKIKKEKHLPDIPSAKEVYQNGIQVGEMQGKLLKKIEELTLYVFQLKKENDRLNNRINKIEKKH